MKKLLAGLAGAIAIAVVVPVAQAAPFSGTADASSAIVSSAIVPVHGWHITCQRDRYGWHRSHIWGRARCVPKRYKTWW